ncbi:UNVERIFIED_CONTAM: hypothetical protein Sradi_1442300 [Sesamum radiatum]|uniref:NFD4 C-terminal domain-containing protein n=1 Tax=Sesamum radiatum TaxID=300843 RepID=A0AAW2U9W9_SESRA
MGSNLVPSQRFCAHTITLSWHPKEGWNTKANLECSVSDFNGFGIHPDGYGYARIAIRWLHCCRYLLRSPSSHHCSHASELFGLKYYGLIYNILILNLPLGSFLFSGLLAGFLYDAQATRTAGGGNTCIGAHCYRLVFVVMAIACVIGFGFDVLLSIRTKSIYGKICGSRKAKKSSVSNLQ